MRAYGIGTGEECDVVFFFKQKTAYEIGTGDWSSDVCSSDLTWRGNWADLATGPRKTSTAKRVANPALRAPDSTKIGRASCREKV